MDNAWKFQRGKRIKRIRNLFGQAKRSGKSGFPGPKCGHRQVVHLQEKEIWPHSHSPYTKLTKVPDTVLLFYLPLCFSFAIVKKRKGKLKFFKTRLKVSCQALLTFYDL